MKENTLNKKEILKGIEEGEKYNCYCGKILENRVAIITGCSSGLGAATTKTFLRAGAKVVGCYYSSADKRVYSKDAIKDVLNFSSQNYKASFIPLDLDIGDTKTPRTLVDKTLDSFGKVDILCNFAGIAYFRNFEEVTPEEYSRIFRTNLDGHFFLTQEVIKEMKKNKIPPENPSRGSIINMASITGLHVGEDGVIDYAMTKGAIHAFTRSLATELGKFKIRANSIAPGSILTPINFRDYKDPERRKEIEKRTCLDRWGFPGDVANVALFFASNLSGYVTGENLLVDGGMRNKFNIE